MYLSKKTKQMHVIINPTHNTKRKNSLGITNEMYDDPFSYLKKMCPLNS